MPSPFFKASFLCVAALASAPAVAEEVTLFAIQTGNYSVGASGFAAGGLSSFDIVSSDFDPESFGLNALIGFDTASVIPNDATVNSIRFEYQIDEVTPGSAPVLLESLLGPFSFGGANVAAQSHTPQGTLAPVLGPGSTDLTVATAVGDLLNPAGRFALRLTATEPSLSNLEFAGSGDSIGIGGVIRNPRRPRLIIDFTPVPEPTTAAILLIGGLACAARPRHRD